MSYFVATFRVDMASTGESLVHFENFHHGGAKITDFYVQNPNEFHKDYERIEDKSIILLSDQVKLSDIELLAETVINILVSEAKRNNTLTKEEIEDLPF